MKAYASKNDIYRDYELALKLGLHIPKDSYFPIQNYKDFLSALKMDLGAKVEDLSNSVANFDFKYPLSVGLFVEVPVHGDHGELLGLRTVVLEHETGLELFLPLSYPVAVAAGAWVGVKVGEKVFDKVLDKALDALFGFFKRKWLEFVPKQYSIDHVEIRTANKGVMRLPFSKFDVPRLRCLIDRLPTISHLRECNEICFSGQLVDAPGRTIDWSTEARERGMPPPLQSCD